MFKNLSNKHKQQGISVLLLGMLLGGGHMPPFVESLIFSLVLFSVALLAHARGRVFSVLLGLSSGFYLLAWTNSFHDPMFNILYCISGLLCLLYCIHAIIHFVLHSRQVSVGEVFALVNCYCIMGYFWALVYVLVHGFDADAFLMPAGQGRIMDTFIYFSFTTMTTVGYGDMVPHSVLAQRLSVTQAMFGQFYFALVVAYLLNKLFQQQMQTLDKAGSE